MRADRLLRLLMLLQRHRHVTAAWLAGELEVSERTVLRDMEALAAAGVPVYTERGRGGGCVLLEGFTTRATGLTPGEAQALFTWASRESLAQLGLGPELTSALAKIAATAPSAAIDSAEALGETVHADRRRWFAAEDDVPWLPALRQALGRHRRLSVEYTSAESAGAKQRTLDPIGIVDHSGRWYLIAEHRGSVRSYRVSRISDLQVLDQPAAPQDTRALSEIWAELRSALENSQQRLSVLVSVAPERAGVLRRLLSMQLATGTRIETVDERPGEPLLWRLSVRQSAVIAAMAVMNAPDLMVLEPVWLQGEIRDGARRALAAYPQRASHGRNPVPSWAHD